MAETTSKQHLIASADTRVSIPEDAPPWAHGLFAKADRNEAAIDQLSENIGRLMGVVMPMREELHTTRGLCEAVALRTARLDQERELPLEKLERLRKDVRAIKEARNTNPGRRSSPEEQLTTDQRNAITREEAEKIAREADEKRERDREAHELRASVARLTAQIAETAAAREKTRTLWTEKLLLPIVVGLVVALCSVYATYRMTRPAVQFEMRETPKK